MSTTNTNTFTVTHAEYLSSKIAADLQQMQGFYGAPSDAQIKLYIEELIAHLKAGYLKSVDYGYFKNRTWVVAVSYEANQLTGALIDNNPGRIPSGKDISGAVYWTYLRRNLKYDALTAEQKGAFLNTITLKRSGAEDPMNGVSGIQDKTYSAGGQEIKRKIIG